MKWTAWRITASDAESSASEKTIVSSAFPFRFFSALALASASDMNSAHRILGSTMSDAEQAFGPDDGHVLALIECGESNGLLRRET